MSRLGVCSWSLQAENPETLAERVDACGVKHVQLALDPLRTGAWGMGATIRALEGVGATVVSGMWAPEGEDYSTLASIRETGGIVPDATWEANRRAAADAATIAAALGLRLVTFHAGFIPEGDAALDASPVPGRLRELAGIFAASGVRLALETGQEHAHDLAALLARLDGTGIGVNFDPANLVLYGMGNPIPALRLLKPHVLQVHVKDAVPTEVEGTWGVEVPVGEGVVDWNAFFALLDDHPVDCVIEREAGTSRVADVVTARAKVASLRRGIV